ncbi:hypothetical protein [Leuconostoc gasicomitatum]|uniref:hypothetical protein n=1 Tax=Leuconostoc gasicomitatum TaxID=115778 RepID=UPI001CC63D22|nr:hypothetical protein [Leuconostoc gasicomitatum]MBZ5951043.1 hypothetical protein [Leuconostoc gasicomitatum]
MNETVTKTYEQAVNDDTGILIADFTAQTSNSNVSDIKVWVNTIAIYQANKDKVVSAFDDFLTAIQKENAPVVSLDNVESTADSETASAEVLSSESESKVASKSELESESESDSTSDSTSDSMSALSQ